MSGFWVGILVGAVGAVGLGAAALVLASWRRDRQWRRWFEAQRTPVTAGVAPRAAIEGAAGRGCCGDFGE